MRWLFAVCSLASILAAQNRTITPMTTTILKPGLPDTVVPVDLKPSPKGGDHLIVMTSEKGVTLELELPDGRRIKQSTAVNFDMDWVVNGQGDGMTILPPGN